MRIIIRKLQIKTFMQVDKISALSRRKTYYLKKLLPLTHAYALWAANVLLAVFAPAFPLSLGRQEMRPQPAQAHSLGR
jgi:uncharacterized membrane protein (GlpM family)